MRFLLFFCGHFYVLMAVLGALVMTAKTVAYRGVGQNCDLCGSEIILKRVAKFCVSACIGQARGRSCVCARVCASACACERECVLTREKWQQPSFANDNRRHFCDCQANLLAFWARLVKGNC